MIKRTYTLPLIIITLLLAACSGEIEQSVPQEPEFDRQDARGSLSGDSGLVLFGDSEDPASKASPIGVNGFLWRATLDTLSFMPLKSADPFGGVIITDWYEDPRVPGERFKADALILDSTLRADGIKITVFKQKLTNGNWRDQQVDEQLARKIEDTVLTRARQLKITQSN